MVNKKIIPGSTIDFSEEEKRFIEDRSIEKYFNFYIWSTLRYNYNATYFTFLPFNRNQLAFLHRKKNIVWWASNPRTNMVRITYHEWIAILKN